MTSSHSQPCHACRSLLAGAASGSSVCLQTDHAVLSDSFDMDSYNELVDLANSAEHADLFATK